MKINEITDHFNDQFISDCIKLHNDIVAKLNEEFEAYKANNPFYFLHDNSRFKNVYNNKLTKISLNIKLMLQNELRKDFTFENYIDALQSVGLDFFITPRVLELGEDERLQSSEKKWRLDYSSKSIEELRSIVSLLEKNPARNTFEQSELKIAKNILNNKIIAKSSSDLDLEIKEFRDSVSQKTTDQLLELIFDESGEVSENEKIIIRIILRERDSNHKGKE